MIVGRVSDNLLTYAASADWTIVVVSAGDTSCSVHITR